MLRYNVRLSDGVAKQEKVEWRERYLSPDLSFVSGVTSQNYHLENFSRLAVTNNILSTQDSIVRVSSENVTRQGYVIIKDKEYTPNTSTMVDYSVNESGDVIQYSYLFLNGKYYYEQNGKYTINNWLTEASPYSGETITASTINGVVKIDTLVWIEDGNVSIDGYDYFYDWDTQIDTGGTIGGLKFYEDGDILPFSDITKCSGMEAMLFTSYNDEVTKFTLTKIDDLDEPFERISYCKYYYYIKYKENYFSIRQEVSDDGTEFNFLCDIPNNILSGYSETMPSTTFQVYYTIEMDMGAPNLENPLPLDSDHLSAHGVSSLQELKNAISYVIVDENIFYVNYDIINANDGTQIAIYFDDSITNIQEGDSITIASSEDDNTQRVYRIDEYSFNENDTNFVIFDGNKYKLQANLCDKVLINDVEYDIEYINGIEDGVDCLVVIGVEKIPMKIVNDKNMLERYGKIVSGETLSVVTAQYKINHHSGITVNGKDYIIYENGEDLYATLDFSNQYTFTVTEIRGSSMFVCVPNINTTDFTDEFNLFISNEIVSDVVNNQGRMAVYAKNKIFGDKEITKELAFQVYRNPISSDDYYNLLDNLDIFVRNGYVSFNLQLTEQQGDNLLQDELVKSKFFEEEKEKAINPITDMEKDVYSPKYLMDEVYRGSVSNFGPIEQIRVNLHFRTRDLNSWKVNEGYNNIESSGISDNWFITDFHPYVDILRDSNEDSADTLINTSDLVGLLNFTNDDVYYQKSKIAKSFLRFSFYDSTNPQTQTLLGTSCVFMDEHRLFKRFIDNSRKNLNYYGSIAEPKIKDENGDYNTDTSTTPPSIVDDAKGIVLNKVSVKSEYIGKRSDKSIRKTINSYSGFSGTVISDLNRVGSEFIIDNKYTTDTSSEGYYAYIFREYSEKLAPKPIYMKIDFNHAGIGKIIPFLIPMHWDANGHPTDRVTLLGNDLETLKKGIPLSWVYNQSYIPLYAVYDFKNKEYAYVFDNRYVTVEDDVAVLNLFELKVMEENDIEENLVKISIDRNSQFPALNRNCE